MPWSAVVLTLVAAVTHALWNRRVHVSSDRLATLAVAGLVGGVLLLPATLLRPPSAVWALVVVSGVVEAVYAALLAAAYARGSLDVTYPVGRGTAPLLVTLGGWAVLAQAPTPAAVAGAVLLGAGLVLVGWAGHRAGQGAAVLLAVLVGVSIATYSVVDAAAVRHAGPLAYLGAALTVQGLVLLAAITWSSRRAALPRMSAALRSGALVGVGVVVAYGLVLVAFRLAPAGRVATLRETSVLVAVALAGGVRSRATWVGATLVVLGALFVV
jgi:drug/metabolite transporter (DMT)-like permease